MSQKKDSPTSFKAARALSDLVATLEGQVPWSNFEHMCTDVSVRDNVIEFVNNGCAGLGEIGSGRAKHNFCARILQQQYFSIDKWLTPLGFSMSEEDKFNCYNELPFWSRALVCAERGCLLIPKPPNDLTTMDLLENSLFAVHTKRVLDTLKKGPLSGSHIYESVMIEEVQSGGWLAIRMDVHPDSPGLSFIDQVPLLNRRDEYIPNFAEFIYAVVGYMIVTKRPLFPRHFVRVSTTSAFWQQFELGHFGDGELRLRGGEMGSNEKALEHTALVSATKLETFPNDLTLLPW